jgi:osmotically-inducible protein OsmY
VRDARRIEEALTRQAHREAGRIGISVDGGIVALTGKVRSWMEKNAVHNVVSSGQGVQRVDDRLTIDAYS